MKLKVYFDIYTWTKNNTDVIFWNTPTDVGLAEGAKRFSATIYVPDDLLPGAGKYLGEVTAEPCFDVDCERRGEQK